MAALIASTIALPTAPIVQGPWNSPKQVCSPDAAAPILKGPWNPPETTTSSSLTGSNLLPSKSSPSTSHAVGETACYSSSSANASSSSTISISPRSVSSKLSSNSFQTQQPSRGPESSSWSMILKTSTTLKSSAGGKALSTRTQTTTRPLTSSFELPSSSSPSLHLLSTINTTDLAGRIPVASPSTTQHVNSTESSKTSTSLQSKSSASGNPAPPSWSNQTSSTVAPGISITNNSVFAAASPSMNPCGLVAQYYNPTPSDWTSHSMYQLSTLPLSE